MLKRRIQKLKAPKKLAYELIADDPGTPGRHAYDMLRALVREFRSDLKDARIALAWCRSWKPDADGRIVLGKCKKASDLDRELMAYDFVILLNRSFWSDPDVTDEQRRALLDHECMHAAVKYDDKGEPEEDAKGRIIYRTRRHDLEEFVDTVKRHGIYRHDLESMAAALRAAAMKGYTPCDECTDEGTPGWRTVPLDDSGKTGLLRCRCWQIHMARLDPAAPPPAPPKNQPLPMDSDAASPPPTH